MQNYLKNEEDHNCAAIMYLVSFPDHTLYASSERGSGVICPFFLHGPVEPLLQCENT